MEEWGFPPTKVFFDLVNMLDTVTVGDRYLNAVLSWSNLWGGVGLVGLNSKNYDLLQTFRSYISDANYNGSEFCSIPKEGVTLNNDLSTMLRDDVSNVAPDAFPTLLFRRNPELKGGVKVIKSKLFTTKDKTKQGQSMAGWRLFELEGDTEFHQALSTLPAVSYTHLTLPTIYSV